jgi:hypothetical protein
MWNKELGGVIKRGAESFEKARTRAYYDIDFVDAPFPSDRSGAGNVPAV